jgi:hypothetical protein
MSRAGKDTGGERVGELLYGQGVDHFSNDSLGDNKVSQIVQAEKE